MSTDRDAKYSLVQSKIKNDPLSADLQWSLFVGALQSYRCDTVLRPFPPSFCFENGEKDVKRLVISFDNFLKQKEIIWASYIVYINLVEIRIPKKFSVCFLSVCSSSSSWRTDRKFLRNPNHEEQTENFFGILISTRLSIYNSIIVKNPRHLGTWTFRYWLGQVGTELDSLGLGWDNSVLATIVWYLLIVNMFVLVVL